MSGHISGFKTEKQVFNLFLIVVMMVLKQASARTIYATVGTYRSTREQVFANRAVTMASTVRRSPNAFHFLRQCSVLARAGMGDSQAQFDVSWTRIVGVFNVQFDAYHVHVHGWIVLLYFSHKNIMCFNMTCLRVVAGGG